MGPWQLHAALRRPSAWPKNNIPKGEPLLLGFALYTRREVIADAALRAFYLGRACTPQMYVGDVWVLPPARDKKRKAATFAQAEACKRLAIPLLNP